MADKPPRETYPEPSCPEQKQEHPEGEGPR